MNISFDVTYANNWKDIVAAHLPSQPEVTPEEARDWCIDKLREEAYDLEYGQGKPREADETRRLLREIEQWSDEAILTLYWAKQEE